MAEDVVVGGGIGGADGVENQNPLTNLNRIYPNRKID